jgi:hypothetical protein
MRQREKLIEALATTPSYRAAAQALGITYRTLCRVRLTAGLSVVSRKPITIVQGFTPCTKTKSKRSSAVTSSSSCR